jgi:pyroglutamyl-peptidase
VRVSYHAGTYVCNHVFYAARHEIELLGSNAKCGFIHVPWLPEQVDVSRSIEGCLPLNVMLEAIDCCIEVVQEDNLLSLEQRE